MCVMNEKNSVKLQEFECELTRAISVYNSRLLRSFRSSSKGYALGGPVIDFLNEDESFRRLTSPVDLCKFLTSNRSCRGCFTRCPRLGRANNPSMIMLDADLETNLVRLMICHQCIKYDIDRGEIIYDGRIGISHDRNVIYYKKPDDIDEVVVKITLRQALMVYGDEEHRALVTLLVYAASYFNTVFNISRGSRDLKLRKFQTIYY